MVRPTPNALGRHHIVQGLHYAALIVLVVLSFALILLMISLSLRPTPEIYADFWHLLRFPPYWGNYHRALITLVPSILRTLYVAATSIAGLLFIATTAAFGFARLEFPGRKIIYFVILAVMTIPAIILLTPHYILAVQLHLRGSLAGLIVFYIAGGVPFAAFLITAFFRAQPREIFEAARVDGATEWASLWRIAVPLAFPILVTVIIMNFIGIYGDFIWPSLMLTSHNQTMMLVLEQFNPPQTNSEFAGLENIGGESAGYAFATLPQLVILAIGMKYFVQGITSGAVKA